MEFLQRSESGQAVSGQALGRGALGVMVIRNIFRVIFIESRIMFFLFISWYVRPLGLYSPNWNGKSLLMNKVTARVIKSGNHIYIHHIYIYIYMVSGDFSDNKFSDTEFSKTDFPTQNFPQQIFRPQIF